MLLYLPVKLGTYEFTPVMSSFKGQARRFRGRSQGGSQITEFAAALVLLVALVLLPVVDLTIVPIRWMLAQEIVTGYARRLALCETLSQCHRTLEMDPSLRSKLESLGGLGVESIKVRLRVSRVFQSPHPKEVLLVERPRSIPPSWLPDGVKAPCLYTLELEVKTLLSPAVLFRNTGCQIPGVTAPFPLLLTAAHEWAHYGRNPSTGSYFLNE